MHHYGNNEGNQKNVIIILLVIICALVLIGIITSSCIKGNQKKEDQLIAQMQQELEKTRKTLHDVVEISEGTSHKDWAVGFGKGINIKLEKCGGLTPARRMITRARELDLKVMVGCFTESSVGISAIAQLLPLLDYVDMDGALLLAEDIASGVTIDRGRVQYPQEAWCGTRLLSRRND